MLERRIAKRCPKDIKERNAKLISCVSISQFTAALETECSEDDEACGQDDDPVSKLKSYLQQSECQGDSEQEEQCHAHLVKLEVTKFIVGVDVKHEKVVNAVSLKDVNSNGTCKHEVNQHEAHPENWKNRLDIFGLLSIFLLRLIFFWVKEEEHNGKEHGDRRCTKEEHDAQSILVSKRGISTI